MILVGARRSIVGLGQMRRFMGLLGNWAVFRMVGVDIRRYFLFYLSHSIKASGLFENILGDARSKTRKAGGGGLFRGADRA